MQRRSSLFTNPWLWIALLSGLYLLLLATRPAEVFFGVPGEWTWSGRPPAPSTYGRWWPAIAMLSLTALVGVLLDRRWERLGPGPRALALAFLVIAIPTLQLLLTYIHYRYPIEHYLYRTIGPHNGFWQAAVWIDDLGDYLRAYPDVMRSVRDTYIHLATHPPGNVLYLWGWRQLFEAFPKAAHAAAQWLRGYNCADLGFVRHGDAQIAAALGQMTVPLLSGFTVLPLYAWAKRLGGERNGWRAAALYALTPTLALFTMRWDTLYPLYAATAFLALHHGLERERPRWWFVAGCVVSLAVFCSFGNATLAPALALYAAGYLWLKGGRTALLGAWRGWLALILGGYSLWGLFHLVTGVSVWDLLTITGGIQAELRAAYSYALWLIYNPYDILALTGFALTIPFVLMAVRAWRTLPRRQGSVALLPALVASAILLAVNLAGVSPGEVGRLWMLWATGMSVSTALWLANRPATVQRWGYPLLLGLLALQSLWLPLFLRVSQTGMPAYVPRTPGPDREPAVEVAAAFGSHIELRGYDVASERLAPGDKVAITLYWRASERPDLPYTAFVHLVDAEGNLVAQHDAMPAEDALPTTCWLPGEIIVDRHPLQLPPDLPSGIYKARVGLYDLSTMERLPISPTAEGQSPDALILPTIFTVAE